MAKKSSEPDSTKLFFYRHLELLKSAKDAAKLPTLLAMDEVMLIAVAQASARGMPFQVLQAMVCCSEISTTTAHRILKRLRVEGWLDLTLDITDNRIKYVTPSKQAEKYFALHSQSMARAVKELAA